ncbi:glycine receptor subunit beta-like [Penaeus japonicus]|uniref:glycine receptor subunit beta-like n=1 Tax=Penaeus japonicus TaxID=27405 RepID=UPI001C70E8E9|nr:glycine receptor subunit beta-like [Penaeus japonicus]
MKRVPACPPSTVLVSRRSTQLADIFRRPIANTPPPPIKRTHAEVTGTRAKKEEDEYDTGSLVDLMNRDRFLIVIQGSEPLPSDKTRYIKAIMFPGSGNPLLLRQELSITFQCQFDLLWFPFDNQQCSINFRLNDVESKLVRMIASEPQYLGPEKLLEYEVRQVTLRGKDTTSGQKLTIVFTNLFLYYLANSYLPSFLLVVISYSTFFFRLEDFNERIMVSITAMLVLVALFQQTSSTILKTTYLKLIDVWYMVCIVVDFVMVILLVVIDFSRYYHANLVKVFPAASGPKPKFQDNDVSKKYNMMARVGLPIVFFVFLTVYGIIAAVQYFTGH